MLEAGCRDLFPFSHESISEVQHWWRVIRSGSQSSSSQRCWMGSRSGISDKFFHTKLERPCLYGSGFSPRGHRHVKAGKGLPPNFCHKVRDALLFGISLFTALRFTFDLKEGIQPKSIKKQPQTLNTQNACGQGCPYTFGHMVQQQGVLY